MVFSDIKLILVKVLAHPGYIDTIENTNTKYINAGDDLQTTKQGMNKQSK